jgi:hypothetical protein
MLSASATRDGISRTGQRTSWRGGFDQPVKLNYPR